MGEGEPAWSIQVQLPSLRFWQHYVLQSDLQGDS